MCAYTKDTYRFTDLFLPYVCPHTSRRVEEAREQAREQARRHQEGGCAMSMKVWASKSALIAEVADVPENWLAEFAANQPGDIRKFAAAQNGRLLYRTAAVLQAVEEGRYFRAKSAPPTLRD